MPAESILQVKVEDSREGMGQQGRRVEALPHLLFDYNAEIP